MGPVYEPFYLVEKSQSIVPGCGFEPEHLERSAMGAMGKELRQKHGVALSGTGVRVLARSLGCGRAVPSAPSLSRQRALTAFVGVAVFSCALVQGLLLSVMVFIRFPVSAGTGADPSLERSPP